MDFPFLHTGLNLRFLPSLNHVGAYAEKQGTTLNLCPGPTLRVGLLRGPNDFTKPRWGVH